MPLLHPALRLPRDTPHFPRSPCHLHIRTTSLRGDVYWNTSQCISCKSTCAESAYCCGCLLAMERTSVPWKAGLLAHPLDIVYRSCVEKLLRSW